MRAVAACLLGLLLAACAREAAEPDRPALADLLGAAGDGGFRRARAPAKLLFPRDHGPHPDTRIEWWYFTANLAAADGRRYGAQLALFRFGLRPEAEAWAGDWSSGQLYMSHLALSDLDAGRFVFDERLERAALGLAGASGQPWRVWLPNCEARGRTGPDLFPIRLDCKGERAGERFALGLRLRPEKPRVLHGEAGYSRKSDAPGSASYYYSYTRLRAEGAITLGAREITVSGTAWMDHEWGSSILSEEQAGWDWFSVQLDDSHELMLFHIRDRAGRPVSGRGSLIDPGGAVHAFAEGTIEAEVLEFWTSPASGARYPIAWKLDSPTLELVLTVRARQPDQELRTRVRYWEGSIVATGQHRGRAVAGEGFLELTGY